MSEFFRQAWIRSKFPHFAIGELFCETSMKICHGKICRPEFFVCRASNWPWSRHNEHGHEKRRQKRHGRQKNCATNAFVNF
ncbi:hypothetical protein XENTR_v10005476 [Xenopus tropicalis]|nr:hypothetical protein XENTR_v10005476 [Xenopus tropicalis]